MNEKTIVAIEISGRRWFQRTYGNTYNSFFVRVRFSDGTEWTASGGRAYGYGSCYAERATQAMRDAGIIGENVRLWELRDKHRVFVVNNVSDVKRERDL